MFVCVYVLVYVTWYVFVCCVCKYICMYAFVYMYVFTYICMLLVCMCVCVCLYVCVCFVFWLCSSLAYTHAILISCEFEKVGKLYMYACMICVCACVCICLCACVSLCMYLCLGFFCRPSQVFLVRFFCLLSSYFSNIYARFANISCPWRTFAVKYEICRRFCHEIVLFRSHSTLSEQSKKDESRKTAPYNLTGRTRSLSEGVR